jgi:hypothetical protein
MLGDYKDKRLIIFIEKKSHWKSKQRKTKERKQLLALKVLMMPRLLNAIATLQ